MKNQQILILIITLISIGSCDFPEYYFTSEPECKSENTDDLKEENQKILIEQLKSKTPSDFRYYFKTFEEEGNNTFMITNFRNEDSCFDIKILVEKWDKLAGMKRTNGYSYPKELFDLKWELIMNNEKEIVKYIDMHKIID